MSFEIADKIDLSFEESDEMIHEEITTDNFVSFMQPQFLNDLASYNFNIF